MGHGGGKLESALFGRDVSSPPSRRSNINDSWIVEVGDEERDPVDEGQRFGKALLLLQLVGEPEAGSNPLVRRALKRSNVTSLFFLGRRITGAFSLPLAIVVVVADDDDGRPRRHES